MKKKLEKILNEINNGTRKSIYDVKLNLKELLTKDSDGVYFVEHLLNNNIPLLSLQKIIEKSPEIINMICKNMNALYYFKLDEEVLFSTVKGKRIIEHMLENKIVPYSIIKSIKNHTEIVDLLYKNNKIYNLSNLSTEIVEKLMTKNEDGIYLIEKYLNDDKVLEVIVPLINDSDKLIELSNKHGYKIMKYANINVLMSNYNNDNVLNYLINEKNIIPNELKYVPADKDFVKFLMKNNLYDYLLSSDEDTKLIEIEENKTLLDLLIEKRYKLPKMIVYNEKTINILYKHNMLNLVNYISNNILLTSAGKILQEDSLNDITLLEYMLDNNFELDLKYNSNERIIEILYKKEKLDLLINCSLEKLFNNIENNKTYFDYILECIKENKIRIKIPRMTSDDINEQVKYYTIIARNDMMEYINDLTEEELLENYNGTTLLDGLLDANSELTVNKILSKEVKEKPKIAIILKSRGLEQKNVNVSSNKEHYSKDYLDSVNNRLGIGPLYEEGELLLNKLYQLFISDGKSDKDLITALVSGYRESLFINYNVNIEELKRLIEIKENNLDEFYYIKKENSGYFSPASGSVFCDTPVVETLLHETGHALHYYLADNRVPENYKEITERARQNLEVLRKADDYANKYDDIKKKINALVEIKYNDYFKNYYTEEKRKEIRDTLDKSKEEKKEEYKSLGIPEEKLDTLLENIFTEEEYVEHQRRIFLNENTDAIIRSEFGSFTAIGDILDAIYEGNLYSKKQKNENDENIKGTCGHGLSYYYASNHGFDEMIANFAYISKSNTSKESLDLLKSIVGDEVYNMISEFYYQNIVYNKEETKKVGGK